MREDDLERKSSEAKDRCAHRISRRRWIMAAVAAAAAVLIWSAADLGRAMVAGRTRKIPPGDAAANYLLFPKDAETELNRALIVSGTELTGAGAIIYYDGGSEKNIARERLSLYPPQVPETAAVYVVELNAEIARRGEETDIRRIAFSFDGVTATLTKYLKSGKIDRCTYHIRADRLPAEVTLRSGL